MKYYTFLVVLMTVLQVTIADQPVKVWIQEKDYDFNNPGTVTTGELSELGDLTITADANTQGVLGQIFAGSYHPRWQIWTHPDAVGSPAIPTATNKNDWTGGFNQNHVSSISTQTLLVLMK